MSGAYIKSVMRNLPKAQIIFDRFHVQRLASDAVDQIRRIVMSHLVGTAEGKFIKNSRWVLLKHRENLSWAQRRKLRDIQRENGPLYLAYLLKEEPGRILDYQQPKRAREALEDWLSWASRSKLPQFLRVAKTIRKCK